MITLVSSPKQHLSKDMQHSVRISLFGAAIMNKIMYNKYVQKSTLERHTILVGFYANACQGRRQCCCWTFYIKNGRVIPMGPLLVGLPLLLPCLPAFPMMYISPESASSTWQYWPVVAAFSHLVSSSKSFAYILCPDHSTVKSQVTLIISVFFNEYLVI
jgi:hypothetical protein